MNHSVQFDAGQYPARVRWFLAIGWSFIAAKCALIWWAMARWSVPFHPLWIIVPTVLFACLATALSLTHHEE